MSARACSKQTKSKRVGDASDVLGGHLASAAWHPTRERSNTSLKKLPQFLQSMSIGTEYRCSANVIVNADRSAPGANAHNVKCVAIDLEAEVRDDEPPSPPATAPAGEEEEEEGDKDTTSQDTQHEYYQSLKIFRKHVKKNDTGWVVQKDRLNKPIGPLWEYKKTSASGSLRTGKEMDIPQGWKYVQT